MALSFGGELVAVHSWLQVCLTSQVKMDLSSKLRGPRRFGSWIVDCKTKLMTSFRQRMDSYVSYDRARWICNIRPVGAVSTYCAFLGDNMKPSLVAGRNETRESFSCAVYHVPTKTAEPVFNAS